MKSPKIRSLQCLLPAILTASGLSSAFAGNGKGNGGDAVVCRKLDGSVRSIETLDRYEARISRQLKPAWKGNPPRDPAGYLAEMRRRLGVHSPRRAEKYAEYQRTFAAESNFLQGTELVDIPDSGHLTFPRGCGVEQIVIQTTPRFPEDRRYQVNADLWSLMTAEDQAIMIFHESLLREILTTRDGTPGCSDETCPIQTRELRYLNSLIFSDRVNALSLNNFVWVIQSIPYIEFIEHPLLISPAPISYQVGLEPSETKKPVFASANSATGPFINGGLLRETETTRLPVSLRYGIFTVREESDGVLRLEGRDAKLPDQAGPLSFKLDRVFGKNPRFAIAVANPKEQWRPHEIAFRGSEGRMRYDPQEKGLMTLIPSLTDCALVDTGNTPTKLDFDFGTGKIARIFGKGGAGYEFTCRPGEDLRNHIYDNIEYLLTPPTDQILEFLASDGLPEMDGLRLRLWERYKTPIRFDGVMGSNRRVQEGIQTVFTTTGGQIPIPILPGSELDLTQKTVVLGAEAAFYVPRKYRNDGKPVWGKCTLFGKGSIFDFSNYASAPREKCAIRNRTL